jgi:hypothetical protein
MTPRRFVPILALAATVAIAGCASAPRERPLPTTRIDKGPGTLAEARKFLEGRWSLMSFEVYPPGRQPISLKGSGVLTYDDYGNLDIQVRTDEETARLLGEAGIAVPGGVISSTGRTVIDLQSRRITYVIEGQPAAGEPAGPLSTSRPRYWQVDGDVLTLTTRDDAGKPLSVATWKRER